MTIDDFCEHHLDYREGLRADPPSLDRLSEGDRRTAEGWLRSLADAEGLDPRSELPSFEWLTARAAELRALSLCRGGEG